MSYVFSTVQEMPSALNSLYRYCAVKAAEHDALPMWEDAEQALRQASTNDFHRFFNYCMKLKRGKGGRLLKGIKKGSALRAEWKSLQGYYRNVTRTSFTKEQCEEINAVRLPT